MRPARTSSLHFDYFTLTNKKPAEGGSAGVRRGPPSAPGGSMNNRNTVLHGSQQKSLAAETARLERAPEAGRPSGGYADLRFDISFPAAKTAIAPAAMSSQGVPSVGIMASGEGA